jgi:hypothetical protein
MKLRIIATAVLLAFVAVSVIFIVLKEKRHEASAGGEQPGGTGPVAQAPAPAPSGAGGTQAAAAIDESTGNVHAMKNGVIAYYFHGTRRCPTCRKLEAYTQEAIASGFADDLKDKRLIWRVVNVDLPDNEHYVRDYSLTTKSVVLVAVDAGKEGRWENLSRIWDLVGDKAAFTSYVQGEVADFQEGK